MAGGQSSEAAAIISSDPSMSRRARTPSSANERLKGVVVDNYEFDSDIDPDDVRMF